MKKYALKFYFNDVEFVDGKAEEKVRVLVSTHLSYGAALKKRDEFYSLKSTGRVEEEGENIKETYFPFHQLIKAEVERIKK